MKQIKERIKNYISINDNIVILDVDRTIINTTSWYQACMSEDLLLSKDNVKKFKIINDKTFKKTTKETLEKFRLETLKLIEKKIDYNFIKKISFITNTYFKAGDFTNDWRFYIVGQYTSLNLVKTYNEAIKYIKFLDKYYGNRLKFIFLSSGYEIFIRGVIDGILQKSNLKNLNYIVLGSQIEIQEGTVSEKYHIDQFEKKKIVDYILHIGGKIRFLADDSDDNKELFELVRRNDGIALNIEHIPNRMTNNTWKSYLKTLTSKNIKKILTKDDSCIGLNTENIEMPDFLEKLSNNTNQIGITNISSNQFYSYLSKLKEKIKNKNDQVEFQNNIEKLVFQTKDKIYLRGKIYYNWLPQYIFIDNRSIIERWKELQNISENCLRIINQNKILNMNLDFFEKVIIYVVLDHSLESVLFLLNLLEQNDLAKHLLIGVTEYKSIVDIIQNIMDCMYAFFYEDDRQSYMLNNIVRYFDKLQITKKIPNNIQIYKTMRELDNNITIFKLIKSVADNLEKRCYNLDYIISFPYGGITLGFAMRSYMKVVLGKRTLPNLLNCHYSSKQKIRENRMEKDAEFSIFKFIPSIYYRFSSEIAKGNKKILLLDNNVTTFKTLDLSKNFLQQIGNEVYTAVAEINYDNIINYLLNKESEPLISNWREVLDFHVIFEYITSFNTWNTSKKSKMLSNIYCLDEPIEFKSNQLNVINVKNKQFIFKTCRVHNIVDLNTVVKNGANMIGIHAVYPNRIKYLNSELKYKPYEINLDLNENFPIALLEIDSIRDMQKYVPNSIEQAILFEKPLEIEDMIEVCKIYQVPKEKIYIQLQHRTNKEYIQKIKEKLSKRIIATIGLFQEDFEKYFWEIHNCLNAENDYILLDLSKHQPDLISFSEKYKESINRVAILKNVVKCMENNDVPIIIADDTNSIQMKTYLDIISNYNINIQGIDMQNCIELKSNEQKYQKIKHNDEMYQVKIRKSPNYMQEWKEFIEKINENI